MEMRLIDADELNDENYRHYYIYPVCDADGEIIMYEVYSDKCTKCIERWSVVKG